jgi:WD40 repeat protein
LPRGAIARLGTVRFRGWLFDFTLSPDGKTIALQRRDAVDLCQLSTGKLLRRFPGEKDKYNPASVFFSPDGKILATADPVAGKMQMWEVATGKELWHYRGQKWEQHGRGAYTLDSKTFVLWRIDHTVRLWEARTGKLLRKHPLPASSDPDRAIVSPDGRILAVLVQKHTVRLWDLATGKKLRSLPPQQAPLTN